MSVGTRVEVEGRGGATTIRQPASLSRHPNDRQPANVSTQNFVFLIFIFRDKIRFLRFKNYFEGSDVCVLQIVTVDIDIFVRKYRVNVVSLIEIIISGLLLFKS